MQCIPCIASSPIMKSVVIVCTTIVTSLTKLGQLPHLGASTSLAKSIAVRELLTGLDSPGVEGNLTYNVLMYLYLYM